MTPSPLPGQSGFSEDDVERGARAFAKERETIADIERVRQIPDDEFAGHKGIYLANLEGWLGSRFPALLAAYDLAVLDAAREGGEEKCPVCSGQRSAPNTIPSGIAPRDQHYFVDSPEYSEGGARRLCTHRFHRESGSDQRLREAARVTVRWLRGLTEALRGTDRIVAEPLAERVEQEAEALLSALGESE